MVVILICSYWIHLNKTAAFCTSFSYFSAVVLVLKLYFDGKLKIYTVVWKIKMLHILESFLITFIRHPTKEVIKFVCIFIYIFKYISGSVHFYNNLIEFFALSCHRKKSQNLRLNMVTTNVDNIYPTSNKGGYKIRLHIYIFLKVYQGAYMSTTI